MLRDIRNVLDKLSGKLFIIIALQLTATNNSV